MKAHTLHWPGLTRSKAGKASGVKFGRRPAMRMGLVVLLAGLSAALVSILTVWAINTGAAQFISATYWAISFVFMALALDFDDQRSPWLAGSALAFIMLAWLGSRLAPEFGVLAGFLLSAWVAGSIFSSLRLIK